MLQVILSAVDDALADAWERFCGHLAGVQIHRGSIFDVPSDAYVSPANSFGFMDGGLDMMYSQRLGWDVQKTLQQIIRERHHGELLVGAAEIVETGARRPRFIIAAPTMRVPMILQETVNPYLAARAVFLLIKHGTFAPPNMLAGERVSQTVASVAFPGLATGIGGIGPNTCAHQVRMAYEEVVLGMHPFPATWADASLRHQLLYTDHPRNLQKE